MAYPNSYGYKSFYRSNPPFHPPIYFPNFSTQLAHSSFTSYPPIWCNYCQDPSHPLEQYPSIGYPFGLGQNQFHTFQGLTSEPYPSHQLKFNNNQEEDKQTSHQMLRNNVPHYGHLEMMANELAVE